MISLARAILDRAAAGHRVTAADLESIPPVQWEVYWDELSSHCTSRIDPAPVRQRNALRIEVLPDPGPRCARQAPDGRGLTWLLSGGDALAYAACRERGCPRRRAP